MTCVSSAEKLQAMRSRLDTRRVVVVFFKRDEQLLVVIKLLIVKAHQSRKAKSHKH